jgi:glycosyltransferase involved in cell wall biosynthesis
MKLTIFTDAWYPQINGVVTTLDMTKKTLEKRGWEVTIVHPDMYRLTIPLQPSTGIFMPLLPMGIADEHVRDADKIHIATEGAIGLAARYSCKKYKKSFTTSFHTKYPEYVKIHTGISPRVSGKYFRWFHRNSSAVMVTTPQMVDYCSELGIKRLKVWSRGVDTELFKPDPTYVKKEKDVIRAVYVGRVSAEKNIETFLNINNDKIMKFVIGDGPQLEEYKAKYKDSIFLGRKTREEIATLLQVQDVFAWPSLTDTFGLVVLEAMACGLPVAAFDNDVNRYIIEDGLSGFLVKKDLELAIEDAIHLKKEDAVARAKQFSWEAATDQFIENLA